MHPASMDAGKPARAWEVRKIEAELGPEMVV
jgi:hypothetical protein